MLKKNRNDKIFFGVCSGIADYLQVDPTLVRVLTFLSFWFSGSITFWAYIILAIILPDAD